MADSTTNLDLISSSQASKEITANALFDAESPAALYGRRASTTANLTFGYYGGRLLIAGVPTAIANGTVALTASNTNYVVAARATGNVTASTANTNWNDTPNYMRLYEIVAGASTVTSYVDHRAFLINDLAFSLGVDSGNAMRVDQTPQSWARLATTALGNTSTNGVLTNTGNNITTFTGTANVTYHVLATGNGVLVHSATMNILQGAANITTSTGGTFDVEMLTANTCNIKNYIVAVKLGEIISSEITAGSAVVLTTATSANVASVSVTPGRWKITSEVSFIGDGSTSITQYGAGISTTSATYPSKARFRIACAAFVPAAGIGFGSPTGDLYIEVSVNTTIYLVAQGTFTAGALSAFGNIYATRY